jgi:hypothetical protein
MHATSTARRPAAAPLPATVPLKAVALPVEHGGWGLLVEPVLLGLLMAPSAAGGLLGLAALAGFLARQPLRLALMDRRKGSRYPRTALAERLFLVEALVSAAAVFGALLLAGASFLPALVAGAPFALAALAGDASGRSREAFAEVAGAVALCASAAAIVLAGGLGWGVAFSASALLALRALGSVLYVRARIRLDRGVAAAPGRVVLLHAAALAASVLLALAGYAPWLGVAAFVVLFARASWGVSRSRAPIRPQRLGFQELASGVLTLALLALGYRAGL